MAIPNELAFSTPKNLSRVGSATYWSTLCLPTGRAYEESHLRLFSYNQGHIMPGSTSVATAAETNLKISNELPGTFHCTRVGWSIFGGSQADRTYLASRAAWAWEFGYTSVIPGTPLDAYSLPNRPDPDASETEHEAWTAERGEMTALLRERVPGTLFGLHSYDDVVICIPERQSFAVQVHIPEASGRFSAPTYMRFTLYGHESVAVPVA